MAIRTFAAIDLGSYEVSMKIFEMSKKVWTSGNQSCPLSVGFRKICLQSGEN